MYSNASKARLLSNLSNEARLDILSIISEAETSVGDLATNLAMSQSAISQHLSRLKADGLVATRRDGQTVFYRCSNPGVEQILQLLREIFSRAFEEKNGYPMTFRRLKRKHD